MRDGGTGALALVGDCLTAADLETAFGVILRQPSQPKLLLCSPTVYAAFDYRMRCVVVREWPGARRWRGPDFKTWLEKRWYTADVRHGHGNRAYRRAGYTMVYDSWNDCPKWIKP